MPRSGKEQGPMPGAHTALRRHLPSRGPGHSSRLHVWKPPLSGRSFRRRPSPAHNNPRFSASGQAARRSCPRCLRMPRHQLLPQSLAPLLLQLARPGFLRPQGSEAGGDTSNVGTVGSDSAYLRAPAGRAREQKGRSRVETRRRRWGGRPRRERERRTIGDRKEMVMAQSGEGARGER